MKHIWFQFSEDSKWVKYHLLKTLARKQRNDCWCFEEWWASYLANPHGRNRIHIDCEWIWLMHYVACTLTVYQSLIDANGCAFDRKRSAQKKMQKKMPESSLQGAIPPGSLELCWGHWKKLLLRLGWKDETRPGDWRNLENFPGEMWKCGKICRFMDSLDQKSGKPHGFAAWWWLEHDWIMIFHSVGKMFSEG